MVCTGTLTTEIVFLPEAASLSPRRRAVLRAIPCLLLLGVHIAGGPNAMGAARARRVIDFHCGRELFVATVADCQRRKFPVWERIRAFEKLALAEQIVARFGDYDTYCRGTGYEWKEGADDLSFAPGRAKWGLERLLGTKLPGVVDRTTSEEERKRLLEEAERLVQVYRNGILALARDHELSAEQFAALKLRYAGKIDPGNVDKYAESTYAMEDLLTEWPPVGRKFNDLISIIGKKPQEWSVDAQSYRVGLGRTRAEARQKAAAYHYDIAGVEAGRRYVFVVVEGIIWSVHIEPID